MHKQVTRYYRQRQHGGRGPVARIADAVALHLIFVLACYLWFRYHIANTVAIVALTAITFLIFFVAMALLRTLRFDRFVAREQARLRDVVLKERLLVLPGASFRTLCEKAASMSAGGMDTQKGDTLYCAQQMGPIGEDALLTAFHFAQNAGSRRLLFATISPLSNEAAALLTRLPIDTALVPPEAVYTAARETEGYAVDMADIEAYIKSEANARAIRRAHVQAHPFTAGNTKKYILCALLLLAVSFFTGYTLYYRMLAGLCATLATTSFLLNRPPRIVPIAESE